MIQRNIEVRFSLVTQYITRPYDFKTNKFDDISKKLNEVDQLLFNTDRQFVSFCYTSIIL